MDAREFTNGMHLIPLDQDKEPTCGRGFLDEANYEQNTQKVIPGEMYGVLTGRPNRVLVIDWDCYGGKCEFELTEEMLTRKVGGEGDGGGDADGQHRVLAGHRHRPVHLRAHQHDLQRVVPSPFCAPRSQSSV